MNLSQFERAALLGFVRQLGVLDVTSRELLRTMRVLAGLDPVRQVDRRAVPPDLYRPSRWDPVRLVNAVFPGACFAITYLFWILFDPPTGASVPSMAATFALMVLLTPMSALALVPSLLVAVSVVVAPVYFLVMPRLDTGAELLALIFVFAFACCLVGKKRPGLKLISLAVFTMMTGISNDQTYSFLGLVDGAIMMLLPLCVIAVVQMLSGPVRPEDELLRDLRRFHRGCARIIGALVPRGPGDAARGHALRKRYFESMVLPVPRRLQAIEKRLDYALFPDNGPEKVRRLIDALRSITFRFQALELAHARLARHSVELSEPFVALGAQLRQHLQRIFEQWSRLERADALHERTALRTLARDLEEHLDATVDGATADRFDDEALADLYALLGSARGLLRAAAQTQEAVAEIDWDQWSEARF